MDGACAGGFAASTFARPEDLEYDDEQATGFELGLRQLVQGWTRSIATGILDDETYDWLAVSRAMLDTGGWPLVASEDTLTRAQNLATTLTGRVGAVRTSIVTYIVPVVSIVLGVASVRTGQGLLPLERVGLGVGLHCPGLPPHHEAQGSEEEGHAQGDQGEGNALNPRQYDAKQQSL